MKKIIAVIILSLFALPSMVSAGGLQNAFGLNSPLDEVGKGAGAQGVGNVSVITGRIINTALTLVGIIFLVLMVYGGYTWMTARGNDDDIQKARKIIYGAVIGLVVVLSAYAITKFVTVSLGGS